MNGITKLAIVCAIGLLSHATVVVAETLPNLIANGSFTADKILPWWGKGFAVGLKNSYGRPAIALRSGMVVQENIAVTGGKKYLLSAEVFGAGSEAGTVYVQLGFRGPDTPSGWQGPALVSVDNRSEGKCDAQPKRRTEKAAFVTGGEAGWKTHSIVFKAPDKANKMVLYLRKAPCSPGEAAFTNVSVTDTGEEATSAAETARRDLASRNLPKPTDQASNASLLATQIGRTKPADSRHRLAKNGMMLMRVHVGAEEDIVTLQAAVDLSSFSARAAGAMAPDRLSVDAAIASEPLMVVGRRNALAAQAFKDADFEGLGDDGFLIRSSGPHILIAGRTPRGTMYGVNWFLDHKLGIRWLSPVYTYWPKTPDIDLPPQQERQVPRFAFREVLSSEADDHRWRQRNLMVGMSHGPSFKPSPPAIDTWNKSWGAKDGLANFFQLLPLKQFQASHPDWYAGGQLAMMNKSMRAAMAQEIIRRLRALPNYREVWFAVHDMDWGWDMDPQSAAFSAKHGGHPSAPRLDMMIDVAAQVRAVLPGARLAFNAYHWSFTPPTGMTVPDHIMVYPMTVQVNYKDPLNGAGNKNLGEDLAGWNAIAKHVLVWDHITNFAGFIQPTPNIIPIGDSIKWLASLDHVEGYMGEGSFNTPGAEFAALRAWMISRLLWDPSQDPQALIADFCERYYGLAAGPLILEYIHLIHDKIARANDSLFEKTTVDMAMFDADFVKRAESLFDAAEKAAEGTDDLKRVRAARIPVDYVILRRLGEYSREQQAIGFDVAATRDARTDRLLKTIAAEKVGQYMQGGRINELEALLTVVRKPAEKPEILKDVSDWKDIQDISFQRYSGMASIIAPDPLASDGAAILLERKFSGWNTQLKFDKLPQSGRWWLYAAIRSDGGADNEQIARLGSAPPMGCNVAIHQNPDLASGYGWYEVPGGPFQYSTDQNLSVYVQPLKGTPGAKVLLDRIVAVPKRLSTGVQTAKGGPCR